MGSIISRVSWLRPFKNSNDIQCPKCKSDDLHWEWHPTVVIGGHCQNAYEKAVVETEADQSPPVMETEHLCRGCLACGYAWCEETADDH